jgi:hypothetical protein
LIEIKRQATVGEVGSNVIETGLAAEVWYGRTDVARSRMSKEIALVADKVTYDNSFPLLKLKLDSTGKTLSYSYLGKIYSSEMTLLQNKKKDVAGEQVMDDTAVFKDWIAAWYSPDNYINLYDKSGTRLCRVPWSTYEQRTSGFCEEDKFFGFRVVNKNTYDTEQYIKPIEGALDYAIVQVQFDPNVEHPCCADCSCGKLSGSQVFCNSCKSCTISKGLFGGITCEIQQSQPSDTSLPELVLP